MSSRSPGSRRRSLRSLRRRQYSVLGGFVVFGLVLFGIWFFATEHPEATTEAPEAKTVMDAQADIPFQILIPAYMPRKFDRSKAKVEVNNFGPGGSPQATLSYHTGAGAGLFITEWLPSDMKGEVLYGSRPVQTKWGPGDMLTQGGGQIGIWVTIGPLRVQLITQMSAGVSREDLLEMANTLGPASNQQVFYYAPDKGPVKDAPLPPPEEIKINDQGVQEFTLVITPGGYTPQRFSVKKGVPVRMTFKQLGQVGCGNTLIFPTSPDKTSSAVLKNESDKAVIEFMPTQAGNFQFYCGHFMFRGIMTVRE